MCHLVARRGQRLWSAGQRPMNPHAIASETGALGATELAPTRSLHEQMAPEPGELVFCTAARQPLDAACAGRSGRCAGPRGGSSRTGRPRELRHTFVSLISDSDVAAEEIARLVGHGSARSPNRSTGTSSGWPLLGGPDRACPDSCRSYLAPRSQGNIRTAR